MRRICFVTGSRAEFGLMRTALEAIRRHRRLSLRLVATGQHLDRSRGRTLDAIRDAGFAVDAIVPWHAAAGSSRTATAAATGRALAALAGVYERLDPDVVLVVGDRVEAFAAAAAAHVAGRVVAHVHGGDRAEGLVDDSLRHAITKLAHVHLAACGDSARRIASLGEQRFRIHLVGAPGLDGIRRLAAAPDEYRMHVDVAPRRFVLLLLHPHSGAAEVERERAARVLRDVHAAHDGAIVLLSPNNDPGAEGIRSAWRDAGDDPRLIRAAHLDRGIFLGLLRDAVVLVGNSSAGILEAGALGARVIDVGDRQRGRPRGGNVAHVAGPGAALRQALTAAVQRRPIAGARRHPYRGEGAGKRIAGVLAALALTDRLRRKLIAD